MPCCRWWGRSICTCQETPPHWTTAAPSTWAASPRATPPTGWLPSSPGHGITSGTISLGGNVYVCGSKPNGQPWVVAIQDPRSDGYAVTVALTDSFAVTSGGYQRYYTAPDGTVYQHILDPKTGYPVESDLLSVSILCDNGTMADAYSTALYVMGSAGAQAFWRTHGGFEMILITTAGQVLYTPGLSEKITPTEGSGYEYASILP